MPKNPKYNVLMLGWEFYPVFAGGMGIATAEIVRGLNDANIGVHFVIPRLTKQIEVQKVHITSAADYKGTIETLEKVAHESENLQKTYIKTIFSPYENRHLSKDFFIEDFF